MDPEGVRFITLLYAYGKPRMCINIHDYAPPLVMLSLRSDGALQALCQQYTSKGSMSSFKTIT